MLNQSTGNRVRIATYNIRNTQDRYPERRELLKQTIHDVLADIIGLQEVAFGEGGQLDYLVDEQYKQYHSPSAKKNYGDHHPDKERRLDGNAIIVSSASINESVTQPGLITLSDYQTAQRFRFVLFDRNFVIVNTHLHYVIEDGAIRLQQLGSIFLWIQEELDDPSLNIILLGDFNFQPSSDEYKLVESKGFKSTFKVINGSEPELTFPTGLTGPHMDTDPPGTFDYIWFRGPNLTPVTANTFGEKQKEGVEGVYPSDHLGVVGEFVIT